MKDILKAENFIKIAEATTQTMVSEKDPEENAPGKKPVSVPVKIGYLIQHNANIVLGNALMAGKVVTQVFCFVLYSQEFHAKQPSYFLRKTVCIARFKFHETKRITYFVTQFNLVRVGQSLFLKKSESLFLC